MHVHRDMQGAVVAFTSECDWAMSNKDGETTRVHVHWLEHHEHSASSVAPMILGQDGPTAMAGDVAASAINANLTHICCDV